MPLKIPVMQYDKTINPTEGMRLIEFAERYVNSFKDDMAEGTLNKVISSRFLGKGQYEILNKRKDQFSDNEIKYPEIHYVSKYRKVITRLLSITENPNLSKGTDFSTLKDLLDFFTKQGYLTKKQIGLIHFISKNHPALDTSFSPTLQAKLDNLLHHHIKKDFMKVKTITELAEILTDIKEKSKEAQPKKKMFFSLSQIRSELSN